LRLFKKTLAKIRQEVDRERNERENAMRQMREQNERERKERENAAMRQMKRLEEQNERERMEKENAIQLMLHEVKRKEEQLARERKEKDQEIAELKNKLSQASLLSPQVNTCDIFVIIRLSHSLIHLDYSLFPIGMVLGDNVSENFSSWNLGGRQFVSGPIFSDSPYKNRLVAYFLDFQYKGGGSK
jgi:hypothetical protein